MKKKLLLVAVVLFAAFALVGCKNKDMIGNYKLVQMKQGETVIGEETLKLIGGDKYTLKVKDNSATMTVAGQTVELTYDSKYFTSKKDKKQKVKYTYKDGKITMEEDGTTMTFKKEKK